MGKIWSGLEDWLKASGVSRVPYHGGALNGNSCKRLLENVDKLQNTAPLIILPYVRALRDFRKVVKSCFSINLHESFETDILAFKESFMDLEISVTPKVHAVLFHVPDFCRRRGTGLGIFSEQASESVHHKFQKIWDKYKVSREHPNHGQRLTRAVTDFNISHI